MKPKYSSEDVKFQDSGGSSGVVFPQYAGFSLQQCVKLGVMVNACSQETEAELEVQDRP